MRVSRSASVRSVIVPKLRASESGTRGQTIPMYLRLLVRFLIGGMVVLTPQIGAQPATPPLGEVQLVELDLAGLSDSEYARLVEIITSEVPVRDWPTVRIEEGDGLERIVDKSYDLYSEDHAETEFSRTYPQTVRLLIDLISTANEVPSSDIGVGAVLRIPPVPVRPKTRIPRSPGIFIYAPARSEAMLYRRHPTTDASRALELETGRPVTATWTRAAPDVFEWDAREFRDTGRPTIALSSPAIDLVLNEGLGNPKRLPTNTITVDLIQSNRCVGDQSTRVVRDSPYYEAARGRLTESRVALRERAAGQELVVIDSGFTSGHGAKVHRAAKWLLTALGVQDLHEYVLPYEFDPPAGADRRRIYEEANEDMSLQVEEYHREHYLQDSVFRDAALWLQFPIAAEDDLQIHLPPTVLQAIIRSQLVKGRWLNFSWQTEAPAGVLPYYWRDTIKDSFISVAAGNDSAEIPFDVTPQDLASNSRHFTNVTYGSPEGDVYGSWANPSGTRVDLVAPGCLSQIEAGMEGSSIASAVVAASAWLKHLLDETPASEIREHLIRSSSLLPRTERPTRSQGFFDPARLIADVGPHYVQRNTGAVVRLPGQIELSAPPCVRDDTGPDDPRRGSRDVIVYPDQGAYLLVKRTTFASSPDVWIPKPCPIDKLALSATDASGAVILKISSPDEFAASIAHLSY